MCQSDLEKPDSVEAYRIRYRPCRVRTLFIGESPPASGASFYRANSRLFEYTRRAYAEGFGNGGPEGYAFLEYFRDEGCYLEDLCCDPVNHLPTPARRRAWEVGVGSLADRLSRMKEPPDRIIVVARSIRHYVSPAIENAGLDAVVDAHHLAFPANGRQTRYVCELAEVLRTGDRS